MDAFALSPEANAGIATNTNRSGMLIWPNPTTNRTTVSIVGGASLQVIDALGRHMGAALRMTGDQQILDLDLPAGTYFVKVTTKAGQVFVERLVIGG